MRKIPHAVMHHVVGSQCSWGTLSRGRGWDRSKQFPLKQYGQHCEPWHSVHKAQWPVCEGLRWASRTVLGLHETENGLDAGQHAAYTS